MTWRHGQTADCKRRNWRRFTHFSRVYGGFRLNSSLKHSLRWIAHILEYIGWCEWTGKSQNKAKELAENTAKCISSPTLFGAHFSIYKNIAFSCGSVVRHACWSCWTEAKFADLICIGTFVSNRRRGCPLQEDLCSASGRRPQFRLLATSYH